MSLVFQNEHSLQAWMLLMFMSRGSNAAWQSTLIIASRVDTASALRRMSQLSEKCDELNHSAYLLCLQSERTLPEVSFPVEVGSQ